MIVTYENAYLAIGQDVRVYGDCGLEAEGELLDINLNVTGELQFVVRDAYGFARNWSGSNIEVEMIW